MSRRVRADLVPVMSAALDALHTKLQARVNGLTDLDLRAEAEFALENWKAAAASYARCVGRDTSGYSVSGRNMAFRETDAERRKMEQARADLDAILSGDGCTVFVDAGGCL